MVSSWENMSSWSGQSEGWGQGGTVRVSQLSTWWGGSSGKKAKTGLSWQALKWAAQVNTSLIWSKVRICKILVGGTDTVRIENVPRLYRNEDLARAAMLSMRHWKEIHETLKRRSSCRNIWYIDTCLWSMKTKSRKKSNPRNRKNKSLQHFELQKNWTTWIQEVSTDGMTIFRLVQM